MAADCGVDVGASSPKAAARAAGMESLKHLKNLTVQTARARRTKREEGSIENGTWSLRLT